MDEVYSELNSYRDSIVWPVAHYIERDLRYHGEPGHHTTSDELRVVDGLIASIANLEILEAACIQFEKATKCKLHLSEYGPSAYVSYDRFKGGVLSPEQVWLALSGEYTPEQIVKDIMIPRHKANKKYGAPNETLA